MPSPLFLLPRQFTQLHLFLKILFPPLHICIRLHLLRPPQLYIHLHLIYLMNFQLCVHLDLLRLLFPQKDELQKSVMSILHFHAHQRTNTPTDTTTSIKLLVFQILIKMHYITILRCSFIVVSHAKTKKLNQKHLRKGKVNIKNNLV